MYDLVKTKRNRQWTPAVKLTLGISLVFLLLVTAVFCWGVRFQLRYREYVSHLSNSTVYAQENLGFHANVEGDQVWVKTNNVKDLFNYILFSGTGRTGEAPQQPADIIIDYGDGGMLRIYEIEESRFQIFLYYTHSDGFSYGYASSKMTVDTCRVNFLSLSENRPSNITVTEP